MENTNQPEPAKGFFEKNKNFLILLLLLIVVIGLSVTILLTQISSNYAQPATVVNTQTTVKSTKTIPTTDVLSQAIKDGKATLYPVTSLLDKKLATTFSDYIKSVTGAVPPPGLFTYFCRPVGGGQGVLIGTQVNMGDTYSNEQYQCVFVAVE